MRFVRSDWLPKAILCAAAAVLLSPVGSAKVVREAGGYKETATVWTPCVIDNTDAMMARDKLMPPPQGFKVYPNVLHFDMGKGGEEGEEEGGDAYQYDVSTPLAPVDVVRSLSIGRYWAGPGESGGTPCDPDVGVGPSHVVAVGNGYIRFYTKAGTQTFSSSLGSFWSGISGVSVCCDCRVVYDWYSQRWFIEYLGFDSAGHSFYEIACSDDSDPNGTWAKWGSNSSLNGSTDSGYWTDYPGMGVSPDIVMFTGNMFNISSGGYGYGKIRVYPKAQFLSGSSSLTYTDFWNFTNKSGGTAGSLQPGRHIGACAQAVVCDIAGSSVNVFGINNPLGTPTLNKLSVSVSSHGSPATGQQLGSSTRYDFLDDRIYDVAVRDNQILVTHNVSGGAGTRLRWYHINGTSLPASISLTQQGNIENSSYFCGYGALQMNQYGTIATGLTRSSSSEYVSLYHAGRVSGDTLGTMEAMVLQKAGTLGYNGEANPCRWGDYCGGALDPSDDFTFWAIGMLANTASSWKTEIYSYTVGSIPGTTPTTLTENNISGQIGQTIAQSATLTKTSDGTPLASKTINFAVNGTASGTGSTNSSGVATANYTILESLGVGSIPITCSFPGDATYQGSNGNATLTVSMTDTTVTVGNASGALGQVVSLSATLKRATDNGTLSGKVITFTIDGSSVGTATTSSSGVATKSYTIADNLTAGAHTIGASFAGNTLYNPSSGTGTLTVVPGDTTTTAQDNSGAFGQTVGLTASLIRNIDSVVVVGRTINFYVAGNLVGTGVTNASGIATYNYSISDTLAVGANTITASFAGDGVYNASSGTATLTTSKANTTTTPSNASGNQGGNTNLTAVVKRTTDNGVLSGKTVVFTVDGGAAGSAVTDGTGTATVSYSIPGGMAVGAHTINANFGGDTKYNTSNGNATLTVYAGGTMATVSGLIDLQNIADPTGQTSTMEFRTPGTTSVLYSTSVTLDGSGNYTATGVPYGTYDIAVKFSNWLRQVLPSVGVSTPTLGGQDFSLVNGDANNDNIVNLLDLSTVLANFGMSGAPPIDGDVTWNGTVDLLDLSTVLSNFGSTGAP